MPWHAAGTLSPREAQSVEAALASDPELARRYELVREELAQTIHLNETLGAPSARAMDGAVRQDRRRAGAAAQRASIDLGGRASAEFFASLSPRTLAWSAGAAALAIVLQAAVIGGIVLKEQSAGGYQTASAPGSASGEGAYALIRFQPQASAADITKFLETNKLSIADGPAAGGLYRVRIAANEAAEGGSRPHACKTLQGDKVVGLIAATE